jgi:hypothetical protein
MEDIQERKNILKTDLILIKSQIHSTLDLLYYVEDDLKHLKDEELEQNLKNNFINIRSYLEISNTLLFNCNRLIK